jgi:hypothetical protein
MSDIRNYQQVDGSEVSKHSRSTVSKTFSRWRLDFQGDWRVAVRTAYTAVAMVLSMNLLFLIVVASRSPKTEPGVLTVYDGDYSKAKQYSALLHVLINLSSTILLGASSYCMVSAKGRSGESSQACLLTSSHSSVSVPQLERIPTRHTKSMIGLISA